MDVKIEYEHKGKILRFLLFELTLVMLFSVVVSISAFERVGSSEHRIVYTIVYTSKQSGFCLLKFTEGEGNGRSRELARSEARKTWIVAREPREKTVFLQSYFSFSRSLHYKTFPSKTALWYD